MKQINKGDPSGKENAGNGGKTSTSKKKLFWKLFLRFHPQGLVDMPVLVLDKDSNSIPQTVGNEFGKGRINICFVKIRIMEGPDIFQQ